jgi:resolvase-like protein
MTAAAGYARVSTPDQDPTAQLEQLRTYCGARGDIRASSILHVSDQRSTSVLAGRGNELGWRESGQVSQQEFLWRWQTERHSDEVDSDIAKARALEQTTELGGVPKRERHGACAPSALT